MRLLCVLQSLNDSVPKDRRSLDVSRGQSGLAGVAGDVVKEHACAAAGLHHGRRRAERAVGGRAESKVGSLLLCTVRTALCPSGVVGHHGFLQSTDTHTVSVPHRCAHRRTPAQQCAQRAAHRCTRTHISVQRSVRTDAHVHSKRAQSSRHTRVHTHGCTQEDRNLDIRVCM